MKNLIIGLITILAILIMGCYHPHWNRPNTTYAELNQDSTSCKNDLKLGSSRYEKISSYEKCMTEKGYQLPKEKVRTQRGWTYYHRPSCPRIGSLGDSVTKDFAENQGYKPCPICKP